MFTVGVTFTDSDARKHPDAYAYGKSQPNTDDHADTFADSLAVTDTESGPLSSDNHRRTEYYGHFVYFFGRAGWWTDRQPFKH